MRIENLVTYLKLSFLWKGLTPKSRLILFPKEGFILDALYDSDYACDIQRAICGRKNILFASFAKYNLVYWENTACLNLFSPTASKVVKLVMSYTNYKIKLSKKILGSCLLLKLEKFFLFLRYLNFCLQFFGHVG